jgi:hypothetical protein
MAEPLSARLACLLSEEYPQKWTPHRRGPLSDEESEVNRLANEYQQHRNRSGLTDVDRDPDLERRARYKKPGTPEWALWHAVSVVRGSSSPELTAQVLATLRQAKKDGVFAPPAKPPAPPKQDHVRLVDGRIVIKAPYDVEAVAGIRSLPGRQWDPAAKEWSLPATEKAVKAVRDLATHFKWRVAPNVPGGAPPPSKRPTLDAARAAKGQADAKAARGAFKGNTVPGPEGPVAGEWRTVKGKHLFFPDKGEVGGDVPEGPWGGAPWRPGWTGKGGRFRGANLDRKPNKRQMRLPGLESRADRGGLLSEQLGAILAHYGHGGRG